MESVAFRRGRLILVPVELSHLGPSWLTMVVDTGSPVTIVRPDAAMEIGLELHEAPGTELLGVTGSARPSEGTVDAVTLFGMTVRHLRIICHPLDARFGFDGILGLDFLQHFNIRIDNDAEAASFEERKGA